MTRRLFANRSLFLSMAVSAGLLVGFIFVTGLSPSIARASVVSGLALTAWYFGREIKPTVLLLTAAVITAMINPLYLWFDLGWYLSFAAFAGVLILAPMIMSRYFKKRPKIFGQIMLETTCAQLMTLPIIAFVFGEVSVISLLANMLVLPLIPIIMLFTFVAGLAGMHLPYLAGLVSWPAEFLLTYTIDIIYWLSRAPWATASLSMDWTQLGLLYSSAVVVILALARRTKQGLGPSTVIE
jgi:competence protein ComEC